MIHHLSIAARNPQQASAVLATSPLTVRIDLDPR